MPLDIFGSLRSIPQRNQSRMCFLFRTTTPGEMTGNLLKQSPSAVMMCLCFIGIMFIPTAIFGGLAYHTEDSMGILHILYNATLLIYWGIVLLLFLTALEGKYNFKLFHQNGSMIEDKMFLPKFVAPTFMLYFLLAVILFVLFNVLF